MLVEVETTIRFPSDKLDLLQWLGTDDNDPLLPQDGFLTKVYLVVAPGRAVLHYTYYPNKVDGTRSKQIKVSHTNLPLNDGGRWARLLFSGNDELLGLVARLTSMREVRL